MNPGDLVRIAKSPKSEVGVVIDITQKKCWRTHVNGSQIDWDLILPEDHCIVLYSPDNRTVEVPSVDLEVVYEVR